MIVSISQIRAARGLIGWSQVALAKAAGVSEPTIKRVEGGKVPVSDEIRRSICGALEAAGVEFVGEGEASAQGGPGVRLKKEDAK